MNLLCLHGFTGGPEVWQPVVDLLGGVTAWCPTLLGHRDAENQDASASSERAHPHRLSSVSHFVDEVDRLASWLRVRSKKPCHLLGYSMGARVGLGLLLGYPRLFTGATLVGVHPGLASEEERNERAALDEERAQDLELRGVRSFVDRWQEIPLFASQKRLPPEVLAQQREGRLNHQAAGLAASLRVLGLAKMPAYRDRLRTLDLPVDLVVGEEDRKFRRIAKAMAEDLPRAEVFKIPGVGHNVVLEAPEAVAKAVAKAVAMAVIGKTEDSVDD